MKKRVNIDTFRIIAALMVVAIHTYPLIMINETLDYVITRVLFRIAVPFFFMITGYFVLPTALKEKEKLKKYTLKIVKIYGISMLIYFPLNLYNRDLLNTNFLSILKDIFINGTFYHLWYFPALLLGIWITYSLLKIKNKKIKTSVFLLLYIIGLFGDSYYGFIKNSSSIASFYQILFSLFDYTRNGLFYAPIFLGIGYFCSTKEAKMGIQHKIVLIISFLLLLLEGTLLYIYEIPRHTSMYISLIPVSYFLFSLLIKNKECSNKIQRNLATWIYILHPLFIVIVRFVAKIFHIENILIYNSMIHYFAVVFLTILFILVVEQRKKWKIKCIKK